MPRWSLQTSITLLVAVILALVLCGSAYLPAWIEQSHSWSQKVVN
jgi:hypothetical protein